MTSLVEVAPTPEEAEQAMKNVITAHIEYSLAHHNGEHLFQTAPLEAWNAFFSGRSSKRDTLEIRLEQIASPFPHTIDLQETFLEAA